MKKSLLIIVLLGAIFRFPFLSVFPEGLTDDEAAHAYDAFSILKTGHTFRGVYFPLTNIQFSQFQPTPSWILLYLQTVPISILGLNTTSARLPSAILGTLTLISFYVFVYQLTKNKYLAFISSSFLALSPWHIMTSRWALEPVTFPILFFTGLYFALKPTIKLLDVFCLGAMFGLAFNSYQIATFATPFIILLLFFLHKPFRVQIKKILLTTSIFSLPFDFNVLTTHGAIFNHYQAVSTAGQSISDVWSNFAIFFGSQIIGISFLGHYFLPIIIFAFIGIYTTLKFTSKKLIKYFLVTIFSVSLILSALTADTIWLNANRSIFQAGLIEILASIGLLHLIKKNRLLILIITFTIFPSVLILKKISFPNYLFGVPTYSNKAAIEIVSNLSPNYDQIIVSNQIHQGFIYFWFYKKTNPKSLSASNVTRVTGTEKFPYEYVTQIDNMYFCPLKQCPSFNTKSLYLITQKEASEINGNTLFQDTNLVIKSK